MSNRRDFLRTGSLLLGGSLLGSQMLHAANVSGKRKKDIGLQLYSLRDAMKTDPIGTLKQVANMGFTTLETANYDNGKIYGMAPAEFKKFVKGLGMKFTSTHLGGPNFPKEPLGVSLDWWKKALEDHAEGGVSFMIKPSMAIPTTLDELKIWCDYYNKIGELTKTAKISFGFHNHAKEFQKIEGEVMYDFMLKNTDPKYVVFEMDTYWLIKGGYSPVEYMNKYPDRFPLLHIKDEKEIGESGEIDFKPIYETAYKIGMKDSFVEVERYNFDPLVSVQKSYDYLKNAAYVR